MYTWYQFLGKCPGDKIESSVLEVDDEYYCACPDDTIEVLDDECKKCVFGDEIANVTAGETFCESMLD